MFTVEDNELLTRVGPGTPMGNLFRRFWLPFLLAEEVAVNDAPPLPVKLLGEELLAFRDSDGKLGLVERYCPHRRTDLFFGRVEEGGLRCVYHGWKFNVHGTAMDMPAEPPNTPLLQEVKLRSYPIQEWGGLVWAYMGDPEHQPPELPKFEWGRVKAERRDLSKRLQECNYAQAVEGGIDSSHVSFLHSKMDGADMNKEFKDRQVSAVAAAPYLASDTAPKFFFQDTKYGFAIGARRNATEDQFYWRLTQFLFPFYTMIARKDGQPISGHAWTPIDDENTWAFTMTWLPERDFEPGEADPRGIHAPVMNDGTFRTIANKTNNYLIDRDRQRSDSCTGIDGIAVQDAAIQESMGPIVDRTKETLGAGDAAIASFRRRLIRMARDLQKGVEPQQPMNAEWYHVRSAGYLSEESMDFVKGAGDRVKALV